MATLDENGVVQFEYGDRIQAPETIYDRLERRRRRERRQMRKAAALGERYGYGMGTQALVDYGAAAQAFEGPQAAERLKQLRRELLATSGSPQAAQQQMRPMEAGLGHPGLSPRDRPSQFGGPGAFPFET